MAARKERKQSTIRSNGLSWLGNLPFFSLSLLAIAYTLLGWYAASLTASRANQMAIAGIIILISLTLVSPLRQIRRFFSLWLQSRTTAFVSIVIFAFAAVMILTHLDFFARWLILLAPGLLVRLDLQVAGYGDWEAFGIITALCLSGYGIGILARHLLAI